VSNEKNTEPSSTDLAGDRTLLANERTFASWMRTSFACIAIGLGFRGLFWQVEPTWLPRGIATAFLLLSIAIIWLAVRRSLAVNDRLSAHVIETAKAVNFELMAMGISVGAMCVGIAIWLV
jgi:putative membrane protein